MRKKSKPHFQLSIDLEKKIRPRTKIQNLSQTKIKSLLRRSPEATLKGLVVVHPLTQANGIPNTMPQSPSQLLKIDSGNPYCKILMVTINFLDRDQIRILVSMACHGPSMADPEPEDDCVKWWRCAPTTPGFHSTKPMDVYSNLLTTFWCTSPANTNQRLLLFHGIPWKSTVCHGKSWKSEFGHGPKKIGFPTFALQ